ncbi:hypothetical protein [Halalkalicoccus tibetensis]|uniref:Sulphur transport domain-containing protein n=1 Tax=Halalkalicoccus tibetensis TaxID=175632 RepID=A0ABD5VA40_9EURY
MAAKRSERGWLPTRKRDWRRMGRTARLVLSIPLYAAVALFAGLVGLTLFVVTQNVPLVRDLVIFGPLPLGDRLTILLNLFPFVGTGFDLPTSLLLVAIGGLTGVNVAMLLYHLREHRVSLGGSSGSVGGVVFGTLGAGCAACGSAVVAGALGVFGAGWVLALLPLEGLEFALLGIVVLVLSTYWLAEGMRGGEVAGCPVDL